MFSLECGKKGETVRQKCVCAALESQFITVGTQQAFFRRRKSYGFQDQRLLRVRKLGPVRVGPGPLRPGAPPEGRGQVLEARQRHQIRQMVSLRNRRPARALCVTTERKRGRCSVQTPRLALDARPPRSRGCSLMLPASLEVRAAGNAPVPDWSLASAA